MRDQGAVTVEAALALCTLLVVLTAGIVGVSVVSTRLRCLDAATEAARLLARGDDVRAQEAVERLGPSGADMTSTVLGEEIAVVVRAPPPALFPVLRVEATAIAMAEPGVLRPDDAAVEPQDLDEAEPDESPGSPADTASRYRGDAGVTVGGPGGSGGDEPGGDEVSDAERTGDADVR